jgi:N-acetylneuraminic acid mutarotase
MNKRTAQSAFNLRGSLGLLVCGAAACSILSGEVLGFVRSEASSTVSERTLTFEERVAYQRAIEEVYWRHRIWPKKNPSSKPSLDAVMSQAQLENKVEDYLHKSQALEDCRQGPITPEQLQAEMDRIAKHTKQPDVLRELFESLGNDPFIIAECLARPAVVERVLTNRYAYDQRIHAELKEPLKSWLAKAESQIRTAIIAPTASYTLPTIGAGGCIDDTWTATGTANDPDARDSHTAVWTGNEMIVWGGFTNLGVLNSGGRYNPSTDSWTTTSSANAPAARAHHTAVWTGSEVIIWGGENENGVPFNSGGRYNPNTDSWTATSTLAAPEARTLHSAIWTGSEMIVWGGVGNIYYDSGSRYDPNTDSWTVMSTDNAPDGRSNHTAVWTGSEMIVWGGLYFDGMFFHYFDTGGRYNLGSNSWTATGTANDPDARYSHTAVWTGSEMIIWGGLSDTGDFNTGGRYNPGSNSWAATSNINAPSARAVHKAVWTGSEMIIWGGQDLLFNQFNTGGRYSPDTDSWIATSTTNAPSARAAHTAVWTGSEMIVWGGFGGGNDLNTGGRYCAQSGPTPTPTATPTATARATATPTPTPTPCTGRCAPTPRPRPTPAPRP